MPRRDNTFLLLPLSTWALVAADLCALTVSFLCALLLRLALPGDLDLSMYLKLIPFMGVFPVIYGLQRLYPGLHLSPAEELKALVYGTFGGFFFLIAWVYLSKSSDDLSRLFVLMDAAFILILLPFVRHCVRLACYNKSWWKQPCIVLGTATAREHLCFERGRARFLGLSLVAELTPPLQDGKVYPGGSRNAARCACRVGQECSSKVEQYVLSGAEETKEVFVALAERYPSAKLLFCLEGVAPQVRKELLDTASLLFPHILLLPSPEWLACTPDQVVSLPHGFGLTVKRNLADPRRLRAKRVLDLVLTSLLLICLWPIFLGLALAVALDSPGGIFYRHRRIGKGGKVFEVVKFRTMVHNSDAVLQELLANSPEAAAEWRADQKLKQDPRITRVGRWLRKTSLDELPQIINVLKGEMSLVGPRPIVEAEKRKYDKAYDLYTRVLPGVTGLWQVSGRNDTSYAERIELDTYYISNWSVWLDLYILLRTAPEVLFQRGAY